MSDESNPDFMATLELEKARLLEQTAAVDRKMAIYARLKEEAAALNLTLVPATSPKPAYVLDTLSDLIDVYKTADSSPYKNIAHSSRNHYDAILKMVRQDRGPEVLAKLTEETFESWWAAWSDKKSMAHAKFKMVRVVVGFGTQVLHDRECQRLFGILSKLKHEAPKARTEHLTLEQAISVCRMAHVMKRPSIAMAQAFQCDIGMLQKDAIGEWVPLEYEGVSDITEGTMKWVRGIRWNEIDHNMILRHQSDGWLGDIEFDLRKAPMVQDEFERLYGFIIDRSPRSLLPSAGPIVVNEYDDKPWDATEFRRWWRKVADACEIPKAVRNSDSRSRSKGGVQGANDETKARLA